MLLRAIIVIGLSVLIFVLCFTLLYFDFYASKLWWVLFFLLGLFEFVAIFGRSGRGVYSPHINMTGNILVFLVIVLSFIFFWWQGGVGMIIAWILWTMFCTPLIHFLMALLRP